MEIQNHFSQIPLTCSLKHRFIGRQGDIYEKEELFKAPNVKIAIKNFWTSIRDFIQDCNNLIISRIAYDIERIEKSY